VVAHLAAAEPAAFDFHLYADDAAARIAIRHREVFGAFAVTARGITVLEASAASPAVAQLLTGIGQELGAHGRPAAVAVTTVDVVPLSSGDPRGLVFSSALLPLTICGVLAAAAIGIAVKFRPAWRQIGALVVVAAVAALGAYLVAQPFLGALPHNAVATWASLALTILAVSATAAGLIALIGLAGLGLAAITMIFVGNPFSGATSAPEMLPDAVNHIGQWLPPGAGANLLRSVAYFGGNGAGEHLSVLLLWTALGFAAIAVGHHSPIRFAANSDRAQRADGDVEPDLDAKDARQLRATEHRSAVAVGNL
jgi:hypothetical protein